jgi:LuxR family maltose regulon positive regulatory protein
VNGAHLSPEGPVHRGDGLTVRAAAAGDANTSPRDRTLELGRTADLDAFLREAGPLADEAGRGWGGPAGPVTAMLRLVQGRHHYQHGDAALARATLTRAATLAELAALPTSMVLALVSSPTPSSAAVMGPPPERPWPGARESVDDEPVTPFAMRLLDAAETRIGRAAARSARRSGVLTEELTDRDLSILRMLPGSASQREIGQAMFLSVNTVKAYNKSLYRKLGVPFRQEAVTVAHDLGLI